ncbi:MAG: class I SAM-dependent methyltransferase [Vicinamibacterales bacterium]
MGLATTLDHEIASVRSWYHQIELAPGVITPGVNHSAAALDALSLPSDLSGCRVLDLGTRDGFFAFECERRGAEVAAVDAAPLADTGFAVARRHLRSHVHYQQRNIWDLSRDADGTFDIVLCLGLLYHLRDPLAALDLIRSLCRGTLYLETAILNPAASHVFNGIGAWGTDVAEFERTPVMQFLPGRVANDDPTNFWLPNAACLRAMLEETNFVVERLDVHGPRAVAVARPSFDASLERVNDVASALRPRRTALAG